MTITQMEVFVKIVELNNFTRAGDELGMTQSAVSHSISNLEKHFGLKLLERSKSGITLTLTGEKIYGHAKEIFKHIELIYSDVNRDSNLPEGTIKIGCFPSVSASFLPKVIRSFTQNYPQVEISLFEGSDQEILTWLKSDVIDLGFITLPNESFESEYITQDEFLVICPKNHILKRNESINIKELEKEKFILSTGGCEPLINKIVSSKNAKLNIKYRVNNTSTILEMVKEQIGITIIPKLSLANISTDDFTICSLEPPVFRRLALASNRSITDDLKRIFIEQTKHLVKK